MFRVYSKNRNKHCNTFMKESEIIWFTVYKDHPIEIESGLEQLKGNFLSPGGAMGVAVPRGSAAWP